MISSLSELAAAGSSRVLLEHVDRLASQPGTVRLDAFTHCLVAKCAPEVIFIIIFYYMEESVLLGTKPLVDSTRHFIRDLSGVFSVCHLCECRIVQ